MKKIYLALIAVAGLLSSCDMNNEPKGVIPDDEAMETVTDAEYFRNGFYNSLRKVGTGGYVTRPEIQADMFIGTIINGNRQGEINNGQIFSNNGDFASAFAGMYGVISSVNFFLPRAEALLNTELDEQDVDYMHRYVAEALFSRAYFYYYLIDHFCPSYTSAIGDTPALGIPIVTVYNPTANNSVYPGRSTLNESFGLIEADLDSCYKSLAEFEAKYPQIASAEMNVRNAPYLGTNTVKAFQARIALLKQDWQKAYDLSNEIVTENAYPLASLLIYPNMWTSDTGNEIIFRPICNTDELGGINSTGSPWLSSQVDHADYIATPAALEQYESTDVRLTTFFKQKEINVFGDYVSVPSFTKFPGNPTLNLTPTNSILNMPKMFRSSEQVLILAEAAYRLNKYTEANAALDKIRKARIRGYESTEYVGAELLSEIQLERSRELIGEGFRISDLRRWEIGFVRTTDYAPFAEYENAEGVTVVGGRDVRYESDDHRYIWPIPSSEIESNPQLVGQQNPGY